MVFNLSRSILAMGLLVAPTSAMAQNADTGTSGNSAPLPSTSPYVSTSLPPSGDGSGTTSGRQKAINPAVLNPAKTAEFAPLGFDPAKPVSSATPNPAAVAPNAASSTAQANPPKPARSLDAGSAATDAQTSKPTYAPDGTAKIPAETDAKAPLDNKDKPQPTGQKAKPKTAPVYPTADTAKIPVPGDAKEGEKERVNPPTLPKLPAVPKADAIPDITKAPDVQMPPNANAAPPAQPIVPGYAYRQPGYGYPPQNYQPGYPPRFYQPGYPPQYYQRRYAPQYYPPGYPPRQGFWQPPRWAYPRQQPYYPGYRYPVPNYQYPFQRPGPQQFAPRNGGAGN